MTALGLGVACLAAALLVASCTSPNSSPSPESMVVATASHQSGEAALCDPDAETGLSALAAELDRLSESTDPADAMALADRLRQTGDELDALNSLGPDAISVRDSAVGAIRDLGDDLASSNTDSESAPIAAQMLREMEMQICPAAES